MLEIPRAACTSCGVPARFKGWRGVVLRDRPFGDRTEALHWHKHRWSCEDQDCPNGSWTEQDDRIAHPRMKLTRRAALRATEDVGRRGRTVNEVGCGQHTVDGAVVSYGEAVVEHPGRFSVMFTSISETEKSRTSAWLSPTKSSHLRVGYEAAGTPNRLA